MARTNKAALPREPVVDVPKPVVAAKAPVFIQRSPVLNFVEELFNASARQPAAIAFFVPGNAKGKKRARSTLIPKKGGGFVTGKNGRPIINTYTPEDTVNYEASVAVWYRSVHTGKPTLRPVMLLLEIVHLRTESWPMWKKQRVAQGLMLPVMKPDADNIEKAVKDALNGIAWVDDTQVVVCAKKKRFGDEPGVHVTIIPLGELPSNLHTEKEIADV